VEACSSNNSENNHVKEIEMKKQVLFSIVALVTIWALAAIGTSRAQAEEVVTTDSIAGTWYGNMNFSGVNKVERIKLTIPTGCEPGGVCGTLQNYPVQCIWEITYDGFSGGAYQYHFSNTLKGACPAGSAGSLVLLPDGTLYRTHQTPVFIATGTLSQRPNAGSS
jgi:hypothetical protein